LQCSILDLRFNLNLFSSALLGTQELQADAWAYIDECADLEKCADDKQYSCNGR
jgi:hypothetical protein